MQNKALERSLWQLLQETCVRVEAQGPGGIEKKPLDCLLGLTA